jgi:hypothetical protein
MMGKRAIRRMIAFAGFVVLPLVLPACTSSGYPFLTNRNPNRDYGDYTVQRPTYGPDTGKPFVLRGYAGADYGPLFPRRAMRYAEGPATAGPQPTVSVEHGAWEPD